MIEVINSVVECYKNAIKWSLWLCLEFPKKNVVIKIIKTMLQSVMSIKNDASKYYWILKNNVLY